ncbi:MAG: DUF5678 domain-containing protein [Bryobacteraceae bacterium]
MRFRLAGRQHDIDANLVKARLRGVAPRPADKYIVEIQGRIYPPKQVLAHALRLPLTSFTTMDANRLLGRLGFVISEARKESAVAGGSTCSERLFERYLFEQGLAFDYEAGREEASQRRDYEVIWRGRKILFEVQEFAATPPAGEAGVFGAYASIRRKIEDARGRFRDLDSHCCNLVLVQAGTEPVFLEPELMARAMFGDLTCETPVGETVVDRGKKRANAATPMSSVMIIERFPVGWRNLECALHNRETAIWRGLSRLEAMREGRKLAQELRGTECDTSLHVVRAVVYRNPRTRGPLPDELFRGPFDEHYAVEQRVFRRLFAGRRLALLEGKERLRELRKAGLMNDASREQAWLSHHRDEFAGQWVALDGDRLIAHGPDSKAVHEAARASGVVLPMIVRVPPADTLPFAGWV